MLSEKSRKIFAFIYRETKHSGKPPTIREIGEEFQIHSTNGVRHHIGALERAGYVVRSKRIARGIEISENSLRRFASRYPGEVSYEESVEGKGIPILGRVAAGSPILAEENLEGRLDIDEAFASRSQRFALRVRGDSMIDAGIQDGDFVVVRRAERAESGEIVVALVGDEATVKTLRTYTDRVELLPANRSHKKLVVRESEGFRILGVVMGLVRREIPKVRLARA